MALENVQIHPLRASLPRPGSYNRRRSNHISRRVCGRAWRDIRPHIYAHTQLTALPHCPILLWVYYRLCFVQRRGVSIKLRYTRECVNIQFWCFIRRGDLLDSPVIVNSALDSFWIPVLGEANATQFTIITNYTACMQRKSEPLFTGKLINANNLR